MSQPSNSKKRGRVPGSKNLTKVINSAYNSLKLQEQSLAAVRLFTQYEGNWNQMCATTEFKNLGISKDKLMNHIRSQTQRAQRAKKSDAELLRDKLTKKSPAQKKRRTVEDEKEVLSICQYSNLSGKAGVLDSCSRRK